MFKELRNDFYNETEKCFYIDAWRTSNQNEEGIVVAKVFENKVVYRNDKYKKIPEIIKIIEETKKKIQKII